MATNDFKLNFGTSDSASTPTDPLSGITDFTKVLSTWGQTPSSGGIDFKAPTTSTSSFGSGSLNPGATGDDWQTKWLGGTDAQGMQTNGILPVGIGALSGLTSAYLGWQQFNLAKDQLAQNKKIFNLNFQNQAQSVNTQLEDRQRARVASNPTGYQSVGDYMSKNQVSGRGI